ncbi:hypothetical protein [Streptomyces caatingaensis]|uniref:hypothetical protein n=1 Tax=Streptomyces caatingaensis TaxID=1678637 RepID=UPI000B09C046|nr:hypothetical protein [Streptomyces caatingaensis]
MPSDPVGTAPEFPEYPPFTVPNPIPQGTPIDWEKTVNELWGGIKQSVESFFGKAQLHKTGGVQGLTTSAQLVKIDPSLVKYDEKGLTIAGVQVFENKTTSLNDLFSKRIKNAKEKFPSLAGGKAPSKPDVGKEALALAKTANKRLDALRDAARNGRPAAQQSGGPRQSRPAGPQPRMRQPLFSTKTARMVRDLETRVRSLETALG